MKFNFVMKQGLLVALLMTFCGSVYSADIINKQCGFQITLPDQFFEIPVDRSVPEDAAVLARYIDRDDASPENKAFVIQISQAPGRVDQDIRTKPNELTLIDGVKPQLGQIRWRGLEMETVRVAHTNGFVTHATAFPFQDPGLALCVAGPIEKESEVIALFDQVTQSYYNLNQIKPKTRQEVQPEKPDRARTEQTIKAAVVLFFMAVGAVVPVLKRVFVA